MTDVLRPDRQHVSYAARLPALPACQPAPTIQHQPAAPSLSLRRIRLSLQVSMLEKEAKQEESQLPGVRNVLTCWRGADLEETDKRPHMLGKGAEKVPRILLLLCIALH